MRNGVSGDRLHFKEVLDHAATPWEPQSAEGPVQQPESRQKLMQEFGIPRRMQRTGIERELLGAGEGAEGIVTIMRQVPVILSARRTSAPKWNTEKAAAVSAIAYQDVTEPSLVAIERALLQIDRILAVAYDVPVADVDIELLPPSATTTVFYHREWRARRGRLS